MRLFFDFSENSEERWEREEKERQEKWLARIKKNKKTLSHKPNNEFIRHFYHTPPKERLAQWHGAGAANDENQPKPKRKGKNMIMFFWAN